MKKIETLFLRRHEVYKEVTAPIWTPRELQFVVPTVRPGCEWVLDGEGVATEKFDGTACAVIDWRLYKRLETNEHPPVGWIHWSLDPSVGSGHGWFPVGEGPDDKWHRQAWTQRSALLPPLEDGTYELVGPKIQGNPYGLGSHELWLHGKNVILTGPLCEYGQIKLYLEAAQIEGIVWHHPDGRMVKIKRRDFGLAWPLQRNRPKVSDAHLDAMLSPPETKP